LITPILSKCYTPRSFFLRRIRKLPEDALFALGAALPGMKQAANLKCWLALR
jgi:hypothetical protein